MVLGATFEADLIFVYLIEEDAMGWQVQNVRECDRRSL